MKKREDIYNLYWYFACERQNIFNKKINGFDEPWSDDNILRKYKFCNAYRVNDRVSQYLLQNVIYTQKNYTDEDIIFRIVLFKIFNKVETWELLNEEIGNITLDTFDFKLYSDILGTAKEKGIVIYNDAYISCANKSFGYNYKHDNHLALLHKMFVIDKMQDKIIKSKSMEEAFLIIKSYPLIGNFMAYQLITDINYSNVVNFTETSFTVAGPGSIRGINKCFPDLGTQSYEDIIKLMCEKQEVEFKRLGLDFKGLRNRPLQYIDCQNLFCELDKYCREAKPNLKSNREKIKKKYLPKGYKISYIYPPKWNLEIRLDFDKEIHLC